MRLLLTVFCVLIALSCLFCGCATSYESELARLLTELEAIDAPEVVTEIGPSVAAPAQESETQTNQTEVAAQDRIPVLPGVNPGQREMTIHPNCLLQISVAEDPSLNSSYTVNDIGAVDLGYVGPVILFNKTEKEAAEKVSEVLVNREFRTATVKVRILRASYGHLKVMGAVRRPGTVKVGAGDTISLNDALLRVDGLSPDAQGGKVRVYRGGMLSVMPEIDGWEEYSLVDAKGKPMMPEVSLGINDLAYVLPRRSAGRQTLSAKTVLVLGEVGTPGFIRFAGSEPCTMLHLLFRIGNLPPFANTKTVRVVRRDSDGFEEEFKVNADVLLEEGRPEDDFVLTNGDRIIFDARRFTFL